VAAVYPLFPGEAAIAAVLERLQAEATPAP
jgi:hypothetical protein